MRQATAILRDASIVYCLTFAFGLVAVIAGWRLTEHPTAAFLTNVLSGALGFAVAAIRLPVGRTRHIALVAVTLWIMSATNVLFGVQPPAAWMVSSFTVLLMALLGGSLAGAITPAAITQPHRASRQR